MLGEYPGSLPNILEKGLDTREAPLLAMGLTKLCNASQSQACSTPGLFRRQTGSDILICEQIKVASSSCWNSLSTNRWANSPRIREMRTLHHSNLVLPPFAQSEQAAHYARDVLPVLCLSTELLPPCFG